MKICETCIHRGTCIVHRDMSKSIIEWKYFLRPEANTRKIFEAIAEACQYHQAVEYKGEK